MCQYPHNDHMALQWQACSCALRRPLPPPVSSQPCCGPHNITFSDLCSADAGLAWCLPGLDSFPGLMPAALPTQLPPLLLPAQPPGAHVPQPMACFPAVVALESAPVCIPIQAHALVVCKSMCLCEGHCLTLSHVQRYVPVSNMTKPHA